MNTQTATAATTTYTAEELMIQGYAAYKAKTSYADLSAAMWLTSIALEMTGAGEIDYDGEEDEGEAPLNIWEALELIAENQGSALVGRAQGMSCCEVTARMRADL